MGTKHFLENKNSMSALLSPVSPPPSASSVSDFSGFHLPPVTPRHTPFSITGSVAAASSSGGTPHYSNLNNNYHRKGRPLPGGLSGLGGNGKKGSSSVSSTSGRVSSCLCRCCSIITLILFWVLVGMTAALFGIIMMRHNWHVDVVELVSRVLFNSSNSLSANGNIIPGTDQSVMFTGHLERGKLLER